jgi:hypothetical protein
MFVKCGPSRPHESWLACVAALFIKRGESLFLGGPLPCGIYFNLHKAPWKVFHSSFVALLQLGSAALCTASTRPLCYRNATVVQSNSSSTRSKWRRGTRTTRSPHLCWLDFPAFLHWFFDLTNAQPVTVTVVLSDQDQLRSLIYMHELHLRPALEDENMHARCSVDPTCAADVLKFLWWRVLVPSNWEKSILLKVPSNKILAWFCW